MSLSLDCINPTEIVVLLELLGSSLDENETKVVLYSSYLSYIIPQTSSRDVRPIVKEWKNHVIKTYLTRFARRTTVASPGIFL